MTGVLNSDKEIERHRHMEGRSYEDECRDWSDAFTSQGTLKIADNHQKLEEASKDRSLKASEGAGFYQHLILDL